LPFTVSTYDSLLSIAFISGVALANFTLGRKLPSLSLILPSLAFFTQAFASPDVAKKLLD
jgi:hypothetical protein